MLYGSLIFLLAIVSAVRALAPNGPWDAFNLAPTSRTVYASSIRVSNGDVVDPDNLLLPDASTAATLSGKSWVTLDFGVEVGGLISMNLANITSGTSFSLAFTESPEFIRPFASDDSTYPSANMTYDGVLKAPAPLSEGYWVQPSAWLRGGFRFLTIYAYGGGSLAISNVSCAISFMPHVDNMRNYSGYFYADDTSGAIADVNFLTKVWYAGAYTVQTDTVPVNTGRMVPFESAGHWANNATLGIAGPVIVDGAKRDRAVWPGDMGIAVPTQFVSTNDLLPTRNALATMFVYMTADGSIPESGPPLSQTGSDTYQAWTLIGVHNYVLYSGDTDWLEEIWYNYTLAVAYLVGKVVPYPNSTVEEYYATHYVVEDDAPYGLMNITGLRDWGRLGGGGINAEGNALLHKVLTSAADLASWLNLTEDAVAYNVNASALKRRFNMEFWLEDRGMYRDNSSTTLCPQDANSFAVLYNLTMDDVQATSVSAGLEENWVELGAVAPELPDNISPFIGGFELQAHFEASDDRRALDLLHREWGYMLYTNLSVQSTLLEGYTANGSLMYRSYDGYNYDAAYTSHSHGWSSGPTSALTTYVLGLSVTDLMGRTWVVGPHIAGDSGLEAAEGGFETPLGWFGVKWAWENSDSCDFRVEIDTPEGTAGQFEIPYQLKGAVARVSVDDVPVSPVSSIISIDGGNRTIRIAL
ncbi:glycoside hydrolase family 78 protein [Fistulina hepatica ATCC 64428]|uniref:Glycoside hydrolase family 78 protein n=1 Tax=Fistulina hepatica ATCC 64428 TaxID=1128425 RepID=A0A0D7ABL0_9AGAR|nr:glycoside hydrolase family 78 protein [Fistulina hepatica ATCC 64428]